jgi:hypothetical protein
MVGMEKEDQRWCFWKFLDPGFPVQIDSCGIKAFIKKRKASNYSKKRRKSFLIPKADGKTKTKKSTERSFIRDPKRLIQETLIYEHSVDGPVEKHMWNASFLYLIQLMIMTQHFACFEWLILLSGITIIIIMQIRLQYFLNSFFCRLKQMLLTVLSVHNLWVEMYNFDLDYLPRPEGLTSRYMQYQEWSTGTQQALVDSEYNLSLQQWPKVTVQGRW